MTQSYSDPERESDQFALPDVETFYVSAEEFAQAPRDTWMFEAVMGFVGAVGRGERSAPRDINDWTPLQGWYWWSCFPGCLPDSDPIGPFDTEAEAIADAQDQDW